MQKAEDKERRKKWEATQKAQAQQLEQRRFERMKNHVNPILTDFTEADFDAALDKISQKAHLYDRESSDIMKSLQNSELSPRSFRKTLQQNLGVNVSPPELSALVTYFDNDKNGMIDSTEFVKAFFRLGQQRKREVNKKKLNHEKMMKARNKKWEKEAVDIAAKSLSTRIVMPPGWDEIVAIRSRASTSVNEFAGLQEKATSFAEELRSKSELPSATEAQSRTPQEGESDPIVMQNEGDGSTALDTEDRMAVTKVEEVQVNESIFVPAEQPTANDDDKQEVLENTVLGFDNGNSVALQDVYSTDYSAKTESEISQPAENKDFCEIDDQINAEGVPSPTTTVTGNAFEVSAATAESKGSASSASMQESQKNHEQVHKFRGRHCRTVQGK